MTMKEIVLDDLDKVCRGCLGKNGEMRPLFGSFLDKMLRMVVEIEVCVNDGLPQQMCVPCVLQVSRAFTFKQVCQRSDQTLRNCIQKLAKSSDANETNCDMTIAECTKNALDSSSVDDEHRQTFATKSTDEASSSILTPNFQQTDSFGVEYATNTDDNALMSVPSELVEHIKLRESNVFHIDDDQISFETTDALLDNAMISPVHSVHVIQSNTLASTSAMDRNATDELTTMPLESSEIPADLLSETYDYTDHDYHHHSLDTEMNDLKNVNKLNVFSPSPDALETKSDVDIWCIECNLNFESQSTYENHMSSDHNKPSKVDVSASKSFVCPTCNKCFAEKKILNRHLKIHDPIKSHACNVCDMTFAESSNLTKHLKKHTGELRNVVGKPNLCSACGKRFKWSSSLSKHSKLHTGHRILTCSYCPKFYVESRSLNIHMRSHTGERPYACDYEYYENGTIRKCHKRFTQMGNLEKHRRVHTGEKPFKCPICSKGFSQSGYVAIHLRTHTGERPYVCSECGRSFAGSNTLAIHKRTHTGERPYPCSHCDKTFARHETAIIHQRTHTGAKPYECQICHRSFISSGHLTGHMRSHNKIKTHQCNVCRRKLASSSSLKVHMKIHMDKGIGGLQENDIDDTVYECNVCKRNIPLSALKSTDELQAYNHQIIDSVLICSNVLAASSIDDTDDTTKHMIVHADMPSANLLLPNNILSLV